MEFVKKSLDEIVVNGWTPAGSPFIISGCVKQSELDRMKGGPAHAEMGFLKIAASESGTPLKRAELSLAHPFSGCSIETG